MADCDEMVWSNNQWCDAFDTGYQTQMPMARNRILFWNLHSPHLSPMTLFHANIPVALIQYPTKVNLTDKLQQTHQTLHNDCGQKPSSLLVTSIGQSLWKRSEIDITNTDILRHAQPPLEYNKGQFTALSQWILSEENLAWYVNMPTSDFWLNSCAPQLSPL